MEYTVSKRRKWGSWIEWGLAAIAGGILIWVMVDSFLNH